MEISLQSAKFVRLDKLYQSKSRNEEVDGVVVHSLGFSAEGSGFESRPRPSESVKLCSTYKLIPSTQNFTNVHSLELHLSSSGYIACLRMSVLKTGPNFWKIIVDCRNLTFFHKNFIFYHIFFQFCPKYINFFNQDEQNGQFSWLQ